MGHPIIDDYNTYTYTYTYIYMRGNTRCVRLHWVVGVAVIQRLRVRPR